MTEGFPNFFWINGPHSPFYNPILLAEYQCDFICDLITDLKADNIEVIEPLPEAEAQYVQLTNDIGNNTLYPQSENYYMGDNIEGKAAQYLVLVWWLSVLPQAVPASASGLDRLSGRVRRQL